LKPESAGAHAARGNVFLMLEQRAAATASYEQALHLDPANAVAHFNLGLILQMSGERERACRQFERAYELAPEIPDLLKNLTLSYIEFERYAEAQALLQGVLTGAPQHFEALKCIGLVLQKTHRPREALGYYEKARAVDSGDAEFLNNFGIVLQDLGRLDAAIEKYDAAIALKPDFTLAIWHRSLAYLLRHDFARGWPAYELRVKSADIARRPTEFARWDGGELAGKTLLIYAEQGLGDEIMFASCIPDVVAAGARAVIECSPKLEGLFRRSFPRTAVYATPSDHALPPDLQNAPIDRQIPIGSLPLHFRRTRADFPRHSG
jgi:tetratricopeptide (TPR) repeat protein